MTWVDEKYPIIYLGKPEVHLTFLAKIAFKNALPSKAWDWGARRRATKAHGPEENPRCWWLPVEADSWNSITYRVFLHPRLVQDFSHQLRITKEN